MGMSTPQCSTSHKRLSSFSHALHDHPHLIEYVFEGVTLPQQSTPARQFRLFGLHVTTRSPTLAKPANVVGLAPMATPTECPFLRSFRVSRQLGVITKAEAIGHSCAQRV